MSRPSAIADDPAAAEFLRVLGRRVRLLRLARELTQDQIADAAGMSRSFVSLVEKGCHGVDVVRLWRLAEALGLSLVELLDLDTPVRADHEAA